jgi:hypothetical protein
MDCRGRQGHGYPEDAPDPGAQGRGFVSMLAGDARFGVINLRLPPMMVRTKL